MPHVSAAPRARLWLIRHGETAWSLSGRHTGRTDLALTPDGEAQARTLGARLGPVGFAHVLTSPRQRARRTCALVVPGAAEVVEPALAEWEYGDDEGLTSAEIHARRPGWDIFRDGCPNGESPAQVAARADRLIESLAPLAGEIALFSHGHFGAVLALRWVGLPVAHGGSFPLAPASLSILAHHPHHPGLRTIALWSAAGPP